MNNVIIIVKENQKKPKRATFSRFDKDDTFLAEVSRTCAETNLFQNKIEQ